MKVAWIGLGQMGLPTSKKVAAAGHVVRAYDIKPPAPALFSFNNPVGACPACRGFGRTIGIDLNRALPDRNLSIADGVVKPFQSGQMRECQQDLIKRAIELARQRGAHWLHVDFEPHLSEFYGKCGFRPTAAGLIEL